MSTIDKIKTKVTYDANASIIYIENAEGRNYGLSGKLANDKFMDIIMKNDESIEIVLVDERESKRKQLIRQLHIQLNRRAVHREDYLELLSRYGAESCTELSNEDLTELIEDVKAMQLPEEVRAKRSEVLLLLHKLGIEGNAMDGWEAVNNYLKSPRIAGKELYQMSYDELIQCIRKLRVIYWRSEKYQGE